MDTGVINGNTGQHLSLFGIATDPDRFFFTQGFLNEEGRYSFWSPIIMFESPIQFLFRYSMVLLICCLSLIVFTIFQNKFVFFIRYQKQIVLISSVISAVIVVFTLFSLNRVMIVFHPGEGRPDLFRLMILPIGLTCLIIGVTQEK